MDTEPTVFVVDADEPARDGMGSCLRYAGVRTELFEGPDQLLENYDPARPGCLVLEMRFAELTGLELRRLLVARGCHKPFIIVTENSTVAEAVQAMRDGAVDFLEKPYRRPLLLERVYHALDLDATGRQRRQEQLRIRTELASLTPREHEILQLVVAGKPTREIAGQLGLSPKTVEVHRSNIVGKMRVESIAELVITLVRMQVDLPTPTLHRRRAV
jgi:FixJ family two-component response regulator